MTDDHANALIELYTACVAVISTYEQWEATGLEPSVPTTERERYNESLELVTEVYVAAAAAGILTLTLDGVLARTLPIGVIQRLFI